jgi:hypothetical protein
MRKMFRALEIALLVTGGLLYVAAKIHFFLRYGSDDFCLGALAFLGWHAGSWYHRGDLRLAQDTFHW